MDADSDEAAFLRVIAADIENDAPRLVFADWLDEHGRGDEAAFIRLQCQFDADRDRFDDSAINARPHGARHLNLNRSLYHTVSGKQVQFEAFVGVPPLGGL